MAETLAGALSPSQKRAIGHYLASTFGPVRFRVLEVDWANDDPGAPCVCVEIVWPFDHGRNYRGIRVGITRRVLNGGSEGGEPPSPPSEGEGGADRNNLAR